MMLPATVTVLDHPLVRHKLTLLRRKDTSTGVFRLVVRELAMLMAYELTRHLPLQTASIETPLETMQAPVLGGKNPCLVSVLRAGNGMLDGMLDLLPSAPVGHIGMYRDPRTLQPVEYYLKLPGDVADRFCIVLDPMLATGGSIVAAVARLKQAGVARISVASLLGAPEGVRAVSGAHPDVPIVLAALDRELDSHGYIRPGLGDAGDRLYGTK